MINMLCLINRCGNVILNAEKELCKVLFIMQTRHALSLPLSMG